MSSGTRPPAYVPTLTEVVYADKVAVTDTRELKIQRVLQHVSVTLEKRLHEATERLVRTHVQALMPPLLDEIERVVRESVFEALEREKPASPVPPDSGKPGF